MIRQNKFITMLILTGLLYKTPCWTGPKKDPSARAPRPTSAPAGGRGDAVAVIPGRGGRPAGLAPAREAFAAPPAVAAAGGGAPAAARKRAARGITPADAATEHQRLVAQRNEEDARRGRPMNPQELTERKRLNNKIDHLYKKMQAAPETAGPAPEVLPGEVSIRQGQLGRAARASQRGAGALPFSAMDALVEAGTREAASTEQPYRPRRILSELPEGEVQNPARPQAGETRSRLQTLADAAQFSEVSPSGF